MNLASNFLFVFLLCLFKAESADLYHYCNDKSKTNSGSQVSENIDTLLPLLVVGTFVKGYIDTFYGEGKDKVYGLAQCRGDVGKDDCSNCILNATKEIRSQCPNQAEAKIWFDYCFLRYDTKLFLDGLDYTGVYYVNPQDVWNLDIVNKQLPALMDQVRSEALKPESKGLGKGASDVPSSTSKLYALVQCTRDLSQSNCAQCLTTAVGKFQPVCGKKRGCRVAFASCYVRYEVYPFFFPLDSKESLKRDSVKYTKVVASKQ